MPTFVVGVFAPEESSAGATLDLPAQAAGTGNVNVHFTAGKGQETTIPYFGDASKCDGHGGWFYDVNPPSARHA